ncbi:glycoside hydrolase family 3 protein [Pontibacter fetidus]|uniref:beta-N-acetylhexosaminidase n=1 Tax=Pontibacter fetidus TaxID=2700082 RepID=A0A6B2H7R7_9BACT|nr:glycoside hydrolase family 3 protein [Pontibacter fetidus]NDK56547.1 glycoside hydrolase family 3 protein [Pontibacter fetidus]
MRFLRFHPAVKPYLIPLLLLLAVLTVACEGTDTRHHTPDEDSYSSNNHTPYHRPATLIEALENPSSPWVDSVFKSLTPEQRIAQLMIIEAFSDKGPKYEADVMRLIQKYQVGGIIFFQGGPVRQAKLTNKYQAAANVPLLIAMDAETGVGMRLDSTVQYPFQQMLGAIEDNGLIYKMGAEVAEEFKRLGMHINFAPVADINNNAANPIIGYRAFGEDRLDVTAKALAYMQGMQENGILATAKHFPGHGDTDVDSHYDLPIIPYSRNRLDSLELYPFKELIKYGVGSIMVAHMHIPKLDSSRHVPSTLSRPIVTGLLKNHMKFKGLIFTDAMVMKGVSKYFEPGEAEVRALMAGNDVLERLNNVPKAIQAIKVAIVRGDLTQEEIDLKCRRVLAAKQWLGLDNYKPIALENLYEDLNPAIADSTNRILAEASVTLLQNKKNIIPLRARRKQRIATVSVGARRQTVFQREADDYVRTKNFIISRKATEKETRKLLKQLRKYDVVLLSLYGPSIRPSNNMGYSSEAKALVRQIIKEKKTITILYDNAYAINQFPGIEDSKALIVAYQPLLHAQQAAAQIVFGKLQARGRLPVTVNRDYKYGDGIRKEKPLIARH